MNSNNKYCFWLIGKVIINHQFWIILIYFQRYWLLVWYTLSPTHPRLFNIIMFKCGFSEFKSLAMYIDLQCIHKTFTYVAYGIHCMCRKEKQLNWTPPNTIWCGRLICKKITISLLSIFRYFMLVEEKNPKKCALFFQFEIKDLKGFQNQFHANEYFTSWIEHSITLSVSNNRESCFPYRVYTTLPKWQAIEWTV